MSITDVLCKLGIHIHKFGSPEPNEPQVWKTLEGREYLNQTRVRKCQRKDCNYRRSAGWRQAPTIRELDQRPWRTK